MEQTATEISFSTIIDKELPQAMNVYISNWDDSNSVFRIVPEPEILIQINIAMHSEDPQVMIIIYRMHIWPSYATELKQKVIFSGHIPHNREGEKDWQFIAGIIRNWQNFRP